jgi:hypothetical protein
VASQKNTNGFGWTPLAYAANEAHAEAVGYLLRQFADHTLSGCTYEDVSGDAMTAATQGRKKVEALMFEVFLVSNETEASYSLRDLRDADKGTRSR